MHINENNLEIKKKLNTSISITEEHEVNLINTALKKDRTLTQKFLNIGEFPYDAPRFKKSNAGTMLFNNLAGGKDDRGTVENQLLLESENIYLKRLIPSRPTLINPNLVVEEEKKDKKEPETKYVFDKPIAIVIPGLSSCSRDRYVKDTCREIAKYTDFLPIVMNRRGYSDVMNTGLYPMCRGRNPDLDSVIKYVRENLCPTQPLMVLGLSLGGDYLQYYLGKKKEMGESN